MLCKWKRCLREHLRWLCTLQDLFWLNLWSCFLRCISILPQTMIGRDGWVICYKMPGTQSRHVEFQMWMWLYLQLSTISALQGKLGDEMPGTEEWYQAVTLWPSYCKAKNNKPLTSYTKPDLHVNNTLHTDFMKIAIYWSWLPWPRMLSTSFSWFPRCVHSKGRDTLGPTCALVICKLDYCTTMCVGLPLKIVRSLNWYKMWVSGIGSRDHTTPVLQQCHWSPVCFHN